MLAALAFRDGINLSYACSTRGEGGQNDIGTERGADLGRAAHPRDGACLRRARDADVLAFGIARGPDLPISAFPKAATRRWAAGAKTVPWRASSRSCAPTGRTSCAHVPRRARPARPPPGDDPRRASGDGRGGGPGIRVEPAGLAVGKLYLPAWSGAGQAYDDDEPPPPATLAVDGHGADPGHWLELGADRPDVAGLSRTQGWVAGCRPVPGATVRCIWPKAMWPGRIPRSGRACRAMSAILGSCPARGRSPARPGRRRGCQQAVAAFPDGPAVAEAACAALRDLRRARAGCPDAGARRDPAPAGAEGGAAWPCHPPCAGGRGARPDRRGLPCAGSGDTAALSKPGRVAQTVWTAASDLPRGWTRDGGVALAIPPVPARLGPLLRSSTIPRPRGNRRLCRLSARERYDDAAPAVRADAGGPARPHRVGLSPEAAVLNRSRVSAPLRGHLDAACVPRVRPYPGGLPEGWQRSTRGHLPPPGATRHRASTGCRSRSTGRRPRPCAGSRLACRRHRARPARQSCGCACSTSRLDDVRVGYVGAGNDAVDHWLRAMGADVTTLGEDDLADDAALARFDSIVIGIFAMRFRPGLSDAMPRLHRWTEAGGTLVTLYHRPWDNWDPDAVPPATARDRPAVAALAGDGRERRR